MQFKKISFNNYRCFLNGTLLFNQSKAKTVNLIIGQNGAGKTEMLFAFWWVLYGFDFSQLQNKSETPYALNQDLHRKLEKGESTIEKCSIALEVEHEGMVYIVERIGIYTRQQNGKILQEEQQSFCHYEPNGETSLPEHDEDRINKELSRIIPKAILYGIIFDGERMKQLSSSDVNARKAIRGVINDITNVDLLENCISEFKSQQSSINRRSKQLANKGGQNTLEEIIEKISKDEKELTDAKASKEQTEEELIEAESSVSVLSAKLSEIRETKELVSKRTGYKNQLSNLEKRKTTTLNEFSDSLKRGTLLLCDKLFDDVTNLLTNYDIPVGLTVEAVTNILKRDKCICGEPWTTEMRAELESLKSSLPPDNINSTIGETVRMTKNDVSSIRTELQKDYKHLDDVNKEIIETNANLISISNQISTSGSEDAAEIERDYDSLQQNIGICKDKLKLLSEKIPDLERRIKNNKQIKASLMNNSEETRLVEAESIFVSKCIAALEKLKQINNMTALSRINEKIVSSYQLLCDEVNFGRRIYIIQYDETHRYKLVSYMQQQMESELARMKDIGEYSTLTSKGYTSQEITEIAIMRCSLSNSTGQSKMNTLAFVKAILDYSNEKKDDSSMEISKSYPLLIDAPFGDVFDKNLELSAGALSTFADQIILMISRDSYNAIEHFIGPHVSTVHEFSKMENNNYSTISSVDPGSLKA